MFRDDFLVKKKRSLMSAEFLFFFPQKRIRERVKDTKLNTNTSSLPYRSLLTELGLAEREII